MFEGVWTAMVTPFTPEGGVDFEAFAALVERQVEAGVTGIAPAGTTGESPTLSVGEQDRLIRAAVDCARGRVRVLAGTGGNSTEEALDLTRRALDAGADATLQVTPYYNKPTQAGLIRHFSRIADLGLPVVLYHVPGRTACPIEIETAVELSRHPGIVAIKEAGGCVRRTSHLVRRCSLSVLSGDDALTLPMMAVGARGTVSVASNVAPRAVTAMVRAAAGNRWEEARRRHLELHPLFEALFLETNPIPVKAALAMLGRIREVYRLPLCELSAGHRDALRAALESAPAD